MKRLSPLVASALLFVACESKVPQVTVEVYPPAPTGEVPLGEIHEVEEGASLDVVVAPAAAGATIEALNLPVNATLLDGVLSFKPSFAQAGTYSVTLRTTKGEEVTSSTIGIRVLNVIHITSPAAVMVGEGGRASVVIPASEDPPGTFVVYELDGSNVYPGVDFDPGTRTLRFSPTWDWRDSETATPSFAVVARGQELDGRRSASYANVAFTVEERTSFTEEILPIFKCNGKDSACGLVPPTLADASPAVGGTKDCTDCGMGPGSCGGPNDGCLPYNGYMNPPYVVGGDRGPQHDPRGRMCIHCHQPWARAIELGWPGSQGVLGNLDLATDPYTELLGPPPYEGAVVSPSNLPDGNVDPSRGNPGIGLVSACGAYATTNGLRLIKPGEPSKSLLYLKVAGIDGKGGPFPASTECGATMPNATITAIGQLMCVPDGLILPGPAPSRYACDLTHDQNGELCAISDLACREEAPDVRKIRLWILAGAPKN